ncbi:MAG: LuxR C-terminal-related transcriptional regulator [Acidobacteriota bacterium]
MKRPILLYSLALAAAALLLQWLDYQYTVRRFSTEIYLGVIALFFTGLGIWVGLRLLPRREAPVFERNAKALSSLGISERELEVLELLAEGCSNQEIADRLFVSLNTVKTHLSHVYDKLDVRRRTQAVQAARALEILP